MFNKNDNKLYLSWVVYDKNNLPLLTSIINKEIQERWIDCDIAMYYINNVTSCFHTNWLWSLIADICYATDTPDAKYIAFICNSLWYYPYNDDIEITDKENVDLFVKRIVYWFPICENYLPKYKLEK